MFVLASMGASTSSPTVAKQRSTFVEDAVPEVERLHVLLAVLDRLLDGQTSDRGQAASTRGQEL